MALKTESVKEVLRTTRRAALFGSTIVLGALLLTARLTSGLNNETVHYLIILALWGSFGLAVSLLVVDLGAWVVFLIVDSRRSRNRQGWKHGARSLGEVLLAPVLIWLLLLLTLIVRKHV